jgi:hypothetical protein
MPEYSKLLGIALLHFKQLSIWMIYHFGMMNDWQKLTKASNVLHCKLENRTELIHGLERVLSYDQLPMYYASL